MEIYEMLRKIREEKHIKQSDIAVFLGTSQRTYSDIERGKIRLTVDDFIRICEFLNIEPLEVINQDPNKIIFSLSIEEATILSKTFSRLNYLIEYKKH